MAITLEISPKEKERIAALAYEGNRLEVFLASLADEGYTASSLYADWKAIELPQSHGYQRFYGQIAVGGYDAGQLRYEAGPTGGADTLFEVTFTATVGGAGYVYNRIVLGIQTPNGSGGWNNPVYPYAVYSLSPAEVLAPGQSRQLNVQIIVAGPGA